jgi:hypothetical protein
MPKSAIVAGCVDTALSIKGIAEELARLCRHPYLNHARPVEEMPLNESVLLQTPEPRRRSTNRSSFPSVFRPPSPAATRERG